MLKNMFRHSYAKVREINKKFETPRIKMSKGVKFALLSLRLYLIVLLGLLLYKFIILVQ